MKTIVNKTFFLILMTFTMAAVTNSVLAEVYKIVDEDGNVTFTDKPPADGSQPIDLKPISVIEAPNYENPDKADTLGAEGEGEGEEDKPVSIRYLRKNYADFAIIAPQQEETIWNPEAPITVAWNTRYQLQDGMQVTIYVDGQLHSRTTEQIVAIPDLDRGEHSIEAQLIDGSNRRVATATPVVFFLRQPGLNNRPRVAPRGP
jgi:hypothetical protein